ncbi:MAG: pyridoxal kinase PdxY [Rhodospirillaceae bacterium]|nr:pyridoxal kinase PdxY [Rhodospirillaceae bacterium]
MQILSVQSSVAYGHVGNAAATFPLQLLGHEVWPVDTVNYSNHPGYGSYRGGVFHAMDIAETLDEIERRGAFHRCDAVLSGFLGAPATGPVLLNAVDRIKRANPGALYVLDPVIGDAERGAYVADGIAEFFRDEALQRADIVVPNLFELEKLSGRKIDDVDTAASAAASLLNQGPTTVVVTGLRHESQISVLLVTGGQAWQVTTPLVDIASHGAGDAFAALFLGARFDLQDPHAALCRAVASIYGVFLATEKLNRDSLALIPAQREIVNPTARFDAVPVWAG